MSAHIERTSERFERVTYRVSPAQVRRAILGYLQDEGPSPGFTKDTTVTIAEDGSAVVRTDFLETLQEPITP